MEQRDGDEARPRVVDKRAAARGSKPDAGGAGRQGPQILGSERKDPAGERKAARQETPEPGAAREEDVRRLSEELARAPARDWVVNVAVTLANVAGAKLERHEAGDARVAVDALAGILDSVGTQLGDAERPLGQTLAQLRFACAELGSGSGGG